MGFFAFILPLVCLLLGYTLGYRLSKHHALRGLSALIVMCSVGFTAALYGVLGQSDPTHPAHIGGAALAFLGLMPIGVGLVFGAMAGLLYRRRMARTHG